MKLLIYLTFLILSTQRAYALEPAFEAYFKFLIGGAHSGYLIQRYEIDDKKKEITSTYYYYVKFAGDTTIESLVARADLNFEPLSYQYTVITKGVTKTVDATFKNKKMTGVMTRGKQKMNITLTVPQSGFMSTYLNYVVLKNGLADGKNYSFNALAEEAPGCFPDDTECDPQQAGFLKGSVKVKGNQKYKNLDVFKLDMNFKGVDFYGYVNSRGEILGSVSPLQNASNEIVATRAEAVGSFPFNDKIIKALFKNIPEGKQNALYAKGDGGQKIDSKSSTGRTNEIQLNTSPEPSSNPQSENQTTPSTKAPKKSDAGSN